MVNDTYCGCFHSMFLVFILPLAETKNESEGRGGAKIPEK